MKLLKGQKLLFIGDSITDCDRAKPEGEGLLNALGHGYVSLVDGLLQSTYPELGIRVVNKGISGNTVRNLKERWQEDVISQQPDWLVIMIGVNDVWRQYDMPFMPEHHVYIEEYEETLLELVKQAKQVTSHIVLMTPFYIEPNQADLMRATMDQYGVVVKKVAEQEQCFFVDIQAALDPVMKHLYPATLAWDRVHPSRAGHLIFAKAFLNYIDFDWNHQIS